MKCLPPVGLAGLAVVLLATTVRADDARPNYCRYDFRASTFTLSAQHHVSVGVMPDDSLLAVWSSRRQLSGRAGIFAQRFDARGMALGQERPVAIDRRLHKTNPTIAIDNANNIWIVWESYGQDGDAGSIIARRLRADVTGGDEICVNQTHAGHQAGPTVATSPDGSVVFAWTSTPPHGRSTVVARRFDVHGQPHTDEVTVPVTDGESALYPAVACTPEGFAVAYTRLDQKHRPAGLFVQRFDAAGTAIGKPERISPEEQPNAIESVLMPTTDGYVSAWVATTSTSVDYDVYVRRLDRQGRPQGVPRRVNRDIKGIQNAPAVALLPNARYVVAWNGPDADGVGVFGQQFDCDGSPVDEPFQVTKTTQGKQAMQVARATQRLVVTRGGVLVCAWSGNADAGDKSSANLTLLTARTLDLAGVRQGVTSDMKAVPLHDDRRVERAEPHRPPTFDPEQIVTGMRRVKSDTGVGFDAILNTGWNPPDPQLAVGPDHLVAITNGKIAIFDKTGQLLFEDAIEGASGFWGSLGTSSFVFDPEALYDPLSDRFFVMATEGRAPPNSSTSYALLAVSDDANPLGTWHKYRLSTTSLAGNLLDSPNLGVDHEAVYISGDGFGYGSNYPVFIFDKASLLAGDPPAVQRSLTMATETQSAGIPPVVNDAPGAFYFIEHKEHFYGNTSIRVIALRDPLGDPYFTSRTLTVPFYSPPEDPPQLGTSMTPETFDARFWSVAYNDGSLWATHHVNDTRVRMRWYEVALNGWPESGNVPTLAQSGELDLADANDPEVRTYFGAISVNDHNDAFITCARSSPNEYISMITAFRSHDDPPGAFRTPVVTAMSTGPDINERWGDYGGAEPDPVRPYTFWAHHQYSTGSWRTWIAEVKMPPKRGDTNCDGRVDYFDIQGLLDAFQGPTVYAGEFPNCEWLTADCNGDGDVDYFDISPFLDLLGG